MLKKMKKTTKNNLITYAMVIIVYVIAQTMISTGSMSSLLEGLMVPLCMYAIMAVSLNLVVGFLGELSLGHAGFLCVGAFSSAFFSRCTQDVITAAPLSVFPGAFDRSRHSGSIRDPDRDSGPAAER